MNENLDLTEILKDCPVGTKFYSSYLGRDVLFIAIYDNCIECEYSSQIDSLNCIIHFRKDGSLFARGECMLFPSKDQRDWSKWHRPIVDGDIVTCVGDKEKQIFIVKNSISDNNAYCYVGCSTCNNKLFNEGFWLYNRLATEEEKQILFSKLKKRGYKWNDKTKTLEKSKKEKFDPKTLKPFESKVLVSTIGKWVPAIFGHCNKEHVLPIIVVGGNVYTKCIPYEGNEHLIDTYDQPSEFYRYWEE